jgi:formate dehydrogenase iron-sulfur subunit
VVTCPFGVIDRRPGDGRAFKCTFCYDRQKAGLQPACATACPTESILFGPLAEMQAKAAARVATLHARGVEDATLYDAAATTVGGIHSLFVLRGDPEDFNLPANPVMPTVHLRAGWTSALCASLGLIATVAVALGLFGS